MSTPVPFTLSVPDAQLDRLRQKLELASFPDELDNAGWSYGAPLADIKRLTAYWKDGFDWRGQEARINQLPQYKSSIEVEGFGAFDIHFVHQKSRVQDAIPLLFVHGWPGSFFEVEKILPLLTAGGRDGPAFHVVAPSLVNFGFSAGAKKPGFGLSQHAETCHKLMQALGYGEYVTQGGDWGHYITRAIGHLYPAACKASHINMIDTTAPGWMTHPVLALQHAVTPYSAGERRGVARTAWFFRTARGYDVEQRTKPQTVGYALHDSPVALLAWIYEKLVEWTDAYPWTDDEILTWIAIYWFAAAGPAASARIYYETEHDGSGILRQINRYNPRMLYGMAFFPKELVVVPKTWARSLGRVVLESEHDSGGHFAAWEKPDVLVADLRAMFGRKGGAYGAVKGKDGYETVQANS